MNIKTLKFFVIFIFISITGYSKLPITDSLDITKYIINIDIRDLSKKEINGNTTVYYISKVENLNYIKLHLHSLEIDSIYVNAIKTYDYSYNNDIITIKTQTIEQYTDTFEIKLYYHGTPDKEPNFGGFYFSDDNNYAFNMGIGMKSNPHSIGRYWFPCIDDFTDKALFEYYITVSKPYVAVCGGILIDTINYDNNTICYHWKMQNPIPPYLASVAIGKYTYVYDNYTNINNRNIPIYIYCNPEDTFNVKIVFSNLKKAISVYEKLYGEYNWERIGYVLVPFINGAMEHATNIAYPLLLGNGTYTTDEELMTHELSHHWFGNLVTCETENDMWFNEGFAKFSEQFFVNEIKNSTEAAKYMKNIHRYAIQFGNIKDSGIYSLTNIPNKYTYGITTYYKGATTIAALMNNMGDTLFFNTIKNLLNDYKYKNINTNDFEKYISLKSNRDFKNFFIDRLYTPGYPHYSIDSFYNFNISENIYTKVFIRQKLLNRTNYSSSDIIEITFISKNWDFYTDTVLVRNALEEKTFSLPFEPDFIIIDKNEKLFDAKIHDIKKINTTGNYYFENTFCNISISSVQDSALIVVTHNWVPPDNFKDEIPGLCISKNRYWTITGMTKKLKGKTKFYYNKSTNDFNNGFLDNELITNSIDSLVILYRPNYNYNWQIIPHKLSGGIISGYLIIDTIMSGEYALAIKDTKRYLGELKNTFNTNNDLKIFPNPSKNKFIIKYSKPFDKIVISDINGKIFKQYDYNGKQEISVNSSKFPTGQYIVTIITNNIIVAKSKLVVTK